MHVAPSHCAQGQLEMVFGGAARNYHMSFMRNDQLDTSEDAGDGEADEVESITFLYQLVRGPAKRSYGLNVARLADIPPPILRMAAVKSRELEKAISDRSGLMKYVLTLFLCLDYTAKMHTWLAWE